MVNGEYNMILNTAAVGPNTLNKRVIPIVSDQYEKCNDLALLLFAECNLKCKFCLNDVEESNYHSFAGTKFDRDRILHYLDHLRNLRQYIKKDDDIALTLFGGELFQDKFDYGVYDELLTGIEQIFEDVLENVNIDIFSNFMFKDPDRVLNLLNSHSDKLDLTLSISFDPVGRYTKPYMVKRALYNFYHIKKHAKFHETVTITGHAKNIDAILNHGENFDAWQDLYDNADTRITFTNYINNPAVPDYQVNAEMLSDFWMYMLLHYPKVANIQNIVHPLPKEQSTGCHELIMMGDTIKRCCENVGNHKAKFETTFGCLYCDYYEKCNETCYFSQHKENSCWRKRIFEYLDEHPQLVNQI